MSVLGTMDNGPGMILYGPTSRGDVLSVFQTPGFFTNLEPDQPGVCTVGRGGGRGKGEGEPIAEPIFSVKI